jgi:hypothetical protein
MAVVRDLERAIADLPPRELAEFRAWFEEFDAEAWDREFEQDARCGKLDALAEKAVEDFRRGRCREL